MKKMKKELAAKKLLRRWFHGGASPRRDCVVIVDLLRFTMEKSPTPSFMMLPGFRSLQSTWIKRRPPDEFQGYGRAHWFKRNGSETKFCVESDPREAYLAKFSVTIFADDDTGLLPDETSEIRELMSGAKLTVAEVAIDFSLVTQVNRNFVRRHGVFGRSRRNFSNKNPKGDWWGARGSGIRVKSYQKDANASHRVEFRMRRRFMEPNGIDDVVDFNKFIDLLPKHHILFARMQMEKLERQLRRTYTETETQHIVNRVINLRGGLTEQLAYLRQQAGLKNTRRLLQPLHINGSIRDAFNAWGASWPTKPTKLRKK